MIFGYTRLRYQMNLERTTSLGIKLKKTGIYSFSSVAQERCTFLDISYAQFFGNQIQNSSRFQQTISHGSIKSVSMIDAPLFQIDGLIPLASKAVMINEELVSKKLRKKANQLHDSIVTFPRRGYIAIT